MIKTKLGQQIKIDTILVKTFRSLLRFDTALISQK